MNRAPAVQLLFLFFSLPLLGQGADLSVTIESRPREAQLRAEYGIHVHWKGASPPQSAVLDIDVPAPIRTQYVWDSTMRCSMDGSHVRCEIQPHKDYDAGTFLVLQPTTPGRYTLTASVSSSLVDPNPANNSASSTVEVVGLPALAPHVYSFESSAENAVSPNTPSTLSAGVENGGEYATNVALTLTLPDGGTFLGVQGDTDRGSCNVNGAAMVCRWPVVGVADPAAIQVRYLPPDRDDGAPFRVHAEVTATQADANPPARANDVSIPLRRRFVVDSYNEDGRGSLRQAMWDASVNCIATPCLIEFRTTSEPLKPLLPLPELAGFIKIAGRGARPVLDGSFLQQGNAIAGNVCDLRIADVTIRNFPGHAIEARHDATCRRDYTGIIDIIGTELTGNLRGIVAKDFSGRITGNTIRDSRRAGMFIERAGDLRIRQNTVSHNAASGIFVGEAAVPLYSYILQFVEITGNVIRDNFEWGVCRTRNGAVRIENNEIAGNRYYAFDVDLDFDTPKVPPDNPTLPDKPVLLSATYDAVRNKTIVRLRSTVQPLYDGLRTVVYASDALSSLGHPQAEKQIADAATPVGEGTIELDGDLRGKWITAATTRNIAIDLGFSIANTSEISNAVRVDS